MEPTDQRHLAKNVETLSLGVGLGASGTSLERRLPYLGSLCLAQGLQGPEPFSSFRWSLKPAISHSCRLFDAEV